MTVPDPPWKRKTRPCPFYSQGRCLFSDSCNFLHDVKIKVKNPEIAIISSPTPQSTPALSRSDSITSSPASPNTVLNKVRSPPRSPRLSSLLLALGNAIEPDAEGDDEPSIHEAGTSRATELVPPDALFGQVSPRRSTFSEAEEEQAQTGQEVVSLNSPDEDTRTVPPREESPVHGHNSQPPPEQPVHEHERTDIMSPVELTTGPPFWHPIGSLPQVFHRDNSIDSGYGDNWTGPQQFALSPPHRDSTKRYSTLSLLSSPFGSPARAISPKFAPAPLSSWPPGSPRSGPSNSESTSEPGDISEHSADDTSTQPPDELDSPTKYEAERNRRSDVSHISEADPEKTVKQSRPSSLLVTATEARVNDVPPSSPVASLAPEQPSEQPARHVPASPEPPQTVHPLEPSPFLLSHDGDDSSPSSKREPEHHDVPISIEPLPTLISHVQSPRAEPSLRSAPHSASRPASTSFDYDPSPASTPLPPSPQRSPTQSHSRSPRFVHSSPAATPPRTSPQVTVRQRSPSLHEQSSSVSTSPALSVRDPLSSPFPPPSHSPLHTLETFQDEAEVQDEAEEQAVSYADLYEAHVNSPLHGDDLEEDSYEDVEDHTVSYAIYYKAEASSPAPADVYEPGDEEAAEDQTVSYASLYASQASPARSVHEQVNVDADVDVPLHADQAPVASAMSLIHDRKVSPVATEARPISHSSMYEEPPIAGPSRLASPIAQAIPTESASTPEQTFSYASFYEEAPLADPSRHSTPRSTLSRSASLRSMSTPRSERTMLSRSASVRTMSTPRSDHTLSRPSSVRSSARRTPTVLPSGLQSLTRSTSSTTSAALLRLPGRESILLSPHDSPSGYASPRVALVDNVQDVPSNRRLSRDGPLSADYPRATRSPSPYTLDSPPATAVSEPMRSPSISRQSSVSDFQPNTEGQESRRSSKVPFGFRNSVTVRRRGSLGISRPGSAPPVRHRPPALVGLSSNRSSSMNDNRQDLESPLESASSARKLKPLRLSTLLNSSTSSLSLNSAISLSPLSSGMFPPQTAEITPATSHPPSSPSVQSEHSVSNKLHLSSSSSHCIPSNPSAPTQIPTDNSLTLDGSDRTLSRSRSPSNTASSASWTRAPSPSISYASHRISHIIRPSSRLSEPIRPIPEDEEYVDDDDVDPRSELTVRGEQPLASAPPSAPPYTRPSSVASHHEPVHAIATPRPTLLFAIASDNIDEVRRVLENGEAGPNDDVGPQSALAFTLTANNLKNKKEIVKMLLAHGANPATLCGQAGHSARSSVSSFSQAAGADGAVHPGVLENLDPATRYYIARADAPQTRRASSLIHRSFFRPLTRVRYDLIGQDRALEQLFRVLSMPAMAPIVVLLCGPSGHGKSLLARRFGSLLEVPTHTVNMTTLRSTRDIWRSYSMSPYEMQEPSEMTLAEFLKENEGQRCVVVLDEIEKTENEVILSSLLMPWELGRVSFEAGQRHVDCSKVIWLGTSNIGHDLVFEHQTTRHSPEDQMSREEYVDLMKMLRPKVSERLGPSLLSRVTTVLPFVPFTTEEKMAIAAEALFSLSRDAARSLPAVTVEKLVKDSLQSYVPAEGARSLYRAVSTLLLDTL